MVLNDQSTDKTPRPGDSIIFRRSDDEYDVRKIDESGQTEVVRMGIASLDKAGHIARANIKLRGRIWIEDYSTPNVFDRF